jgi:hypothetical protein
MKPHKLRLIGITLAILACWWCASKRSPLPSPESVSAAPTPQANAVSPAVSRACQSVVYQIVTIQQFVMDQKLSSPVAALDELVAEEYRIDTSKCPTDFRMAIARFVTAENSARIHAGVDKTGNACSELVAAIETITTRGMSTPSWNNTTEKIGNHQNQDLANIQSAQSDLTQLAMKYGVK